MDREALEQLLTAYTAAEQEYLREGTPDKEVPQPSELLEEEDPPRGEYRDCPAGQIPSGRKP